MSTPAGTPMEEDHFERIYRQQAGAYQRLVQAEDVDRNLSAALHALADLSGKQILDAGAGTGRIAQLLDRVDRQIIGVDRIPAMLAENQRMRARQGGGWSLVQADLRSLPFPQGEFEITICGWAIGHWCFWSTQEWQQQVDRLLAELERVTRPGGWLMVLETLGTGTQQPGPPNPKLAEYYQRLEQVWGFERQVLATDYAFESVEAAAAGLSFFFGPELEAKIRQHQWQRVPEWTGLWAVQL